MGEYTHGSSVAESECTHRAQGYSACAGGKAKQAAKTELEKLKVR